MISPHNSLTHTTLLSFLHFCDTVMQPTLETSQAEVMSILYPLSAAAPAPIAIQEWNSWIVRNLSGICYNCQEIATIVRQSYKKACRKIKLQRERETNMERCNNIKQTTENRGFSQEDSGHRASGGPRAAQPLVLCHPCPCWGGQKMPTQQHQGEAPTGHRGFCWLLQRFCWPAKTLLSSEHANA